jgi:hypothetical protein
MQPLVRRVRISAQCRDEPRATRATARVLLDEAAAALYGMAALVDGGISHRIREEHPMHGAIVIRWGQNIAGREAKGLEVFGTAVGHFEGLAKQGRIDGHQEYFSVTGLDGGFMIVDGDLAELAKIATEKETLALNAKASAIVEGFEITLYAGGTDQSVQELMGNYTSSMGDLGYM